MISRHPLREGLIAGLLGATAIAVWTFAIDAISGRAGVTAALIGAWMFNVIGGSFGGRGFGVHVAAFTIGLYVGVIVLGVITSYVYNAAERKPSFLFGLVMLVLVLEMVLLTITALAAQSEMFGWRAWMYGLIGNVAGGFAMGRYLWRRHHPQAAWDWEHANESHFHTEHGAEQGAKA
jgi:hypothetical protein